jgi:hypothetical protein
VKDHSLHQFLPLFKQRLLAYIEHSRKDKKWRMAAVNAITILIQAGVQFIGHAHRQIFSERRSNRFWQHGRDGNVVGRKDWQLSSYHYRS